MLSLGEKSPALFINTSLILAGRSLETEPNGRARLLGYVLLLVAWI